MPKCQNHGSVLHKKVEKKREGRRRESECEERRHKDEGVEKRG